MPAAQRNKKGPAHLPVFLVLVLQNRGAEAEPRENLIKRFTAS